MKSNLLFFFSIISFLSCTNQNKVKKQKIGAFFVEGKFIRDSVMDGAMKYFDSNNHLAAIINYENGIKNGTSVNYYLNGKILDSSFFHNGLQNGFHYVYDSVGNLTYKDFFSGGHSFGPEFYYLHGKIDKYYFSNYEKYYLYSAFYDTLGNLLSENGDLNFVNPYTVEVDGKLGFGVFAYFLNPPHINIQYSLFLKDTLTHKDSLVKNFNNLRVYIDTVFTMPIGNQLQYYFKTDYYDSTKMKQKIIITKLVSNM